MYTWVDQDEFEYDLGKSTTYMYPKFDLKRVQTHDLQIINSTFHVHETLVL